MRTRRLFALPRPAARQCRFADGATAAGGGGNGCGGNGGGDIAGGCRRCWSSTICECVSGSVSFSSSGSQAAEEAAAGDDAAAIAGLSSSIGAGRFAFGRAVAEEAAAAAADGCCCGGIANHGVTVDAAGSLLRRTDVSRAILGGGGGGGGGGGEGDGVLAGRPRGWRGRSRS